MHKSLTNFRFVGNQLQSLSKPEKQIVEQSFTPIFKCAQTQTDVFFRTGQFCLKYPVYSLTAHFKSTTNVFSKLKKNVIASSKCTL